MSSTQLLCQVCKRRSSSPGYTLCDSAGCFDIWYTQWLLGGKG